MRLVDRVRLNCAVRSCAQFSDSCCCGCGTGLRLGMPLLLSILWYCPGIVDVVFGRRCACGRGDSGGGGRGEVVRERTIECE
jgi:hypothetical protein